jgi:hypothetical protein
LHRDDVSRLLETQTSKDVEVSISKKKIISI